MDLQILIQRLEDQEETKAYNDRRVRKSKVFSINKTLKKIKENDEQRKTK